MKAHPNSGENMSGPHEKEQLILPRGGQLFLGFTARELSLRLGNAQPCAGCLTLPPVPRASEVGQRDMSRPVLSCPSSHRWTGRTGRQGGWARLMVLSLLINLCRFCFVRVVGGQVPRKGHRKFTGLIIRKREVHIWSCSLLARLSA